VCDRPKIDDPPAKGGKDGKDGKGGKGKSKGGKDGKGNPLIKQLGEVPEANDAGKDLRRNDSDPKEPKPEQQKELSELEKKVIKTMRERREILETQANPEELESLVDVLTKLNTKIGFKALKVKEERKSEEPYGLIDSGASHCVREVKDDEEFHSLIPIKVNIPFKSKVGSQLFMTRSGTIVGPKGTETIVSMNELAKIGWKVVWMEIKWTSRKVRPNFQL
jgi:hypothetical protein